MQKRIFSTCPRAVMQKYELQNYHDKSCQHRGAGVLTTCRKIHEKGTFWTTQQYLDCLLYATFSMHLSPLQHAFQLSTMRSGRFIVKPREIRNWSKDDVLSFTAH
jgi:hypothetical protein